jgi:hypothetical protein
MSGLPAIDIAIGLIFIYLLFALVCTAINELIAGLIHRRGGNLQSGVQKLLDQPDLADRRWKALSEEFYAHPLIKPLYENNRRPSYIPPRTFALALLDVLAPADANRRPRSERLHEALNRMPSDSNLRKALLVLIEESSNDAQKFVENIESWFNVAMDRVAATYKNKTQWITFGLALLVAAIVNADTIRLARSLGSNPALREALVAQAQVYAKEATTPDSGASKQKTVSSPEDRVRESITELGQLGLPLGWRHFPRDPAEWGSAFVGILITSLAISLGAPFWFDMLNKVINIRAIGKSPVEIRNSRPAPAPPEAAGAAKP